jgi:hypothetical protein
LSPLSHTLGWSLAELTYQRSQSETEHFTCTTSSGNPVMYAAIGILPLWPCNARCWRNF